MIGFEYKIVKMSGLLYIFLMWIEYVIMNVIIPHKISLGWFIYHKTKVT